MRFRSHKPSPALSDFVENFWLCEGYTSPHLQERILPTGTFGLVFNLRDEELRIYTARDPHRCSRLSGMAVCGPYGRYFVTDRAEDASVMGVHLKPGGAFPFLGLAADELMDTHVDLQDLWGRAALEIHERVSAEHTPDRRFQVLESALLSRLVRRPECHPAVLSALDHFRRNSSRIAIRKLAREVGLSQRRFIDVFNFEVGVKPKLFARILRFGHAVRRLQRDQVTSWAELADACGYADQAH